LNRFPLLWLVCQTLLVTSTARPDSNPAPPVAARHPHVTELHGDRREDPYFWLREKTNPAVVAYLKAENAYTARVTKPTEALRRRLFREMRSHLKETDLSVPYFHDGFFYYTRTEKGRQYAIHCRRRGTMQAPEEVILDLNRLARGRPFLAVGEMAVSDDGNLLAYTTDITGFRDYALQVKDLRTGRLLALRASHVDGVAWAADNRTLWFTVEDEAKRPHQLLRARVDEASGATVVFTEPDERFTVDVDRSRSRDWLFLNIESHTTSEVRLLRADDPMGTWRTVAPRQQDHEYSLDHHGAWFYIRSNQAGRDFALFRAPVADPSRSRWEPVVPHRPGVLIEGMDFFEHFYVLSELENALPHLRFTDLDTGESHRVSFDEAAYFVQLHANPEFRTERIRYVYQSFTRPAAVMEYDWKARRSQLLKQTEVPGGFDPAAYESERVEATAPDGRRVPISLVYRKGTPRDGSAPMLLTGYGAYGIPSRAYFSVPRLSLLDRGVVYAVAHIRGGGDLGKRWHDEGRMRNKRNTFTDFIACAEHLVSTRRTASDRLAIQGGSAGGLLIGAVLNLRPDLFHAAILDVPFVDVLNTMLDETLPLTVGEFEEWGNPKESGDYACMRSYCPYTNLSARRYPAILVTTSLNDSQVMYWEPAKYTAKLRTLKQDRNPLLLRVNMAAGHGGASGRYDAMKESAFDYAFLLHQWGLDR
jgi:oligopeptidase B